MPAQNNDTSNNMLGTGVSEDGIGVAADISNGGGGQDNPAFETEVVDDDVTAATSMSESSPASRRSSRGDQTTNMTNGRNNNDHVEMVPLNPQSMTTTDSAPKSTNGTSSSAAAVAASNNNNDDKNKKNTAKSNDKAALDNMYSEYFRPVNTRRKLLRGEKLYVTRDQRAQSRSWKWIAFWGGVFTLLAAALLTGILAATGIIMSHSKPFLGTSDSLVALNNLTCDDTNSSSDGTEGYTSVHDFNAETTTRTSPADNVVRDFDNTLDDGDDHGGGGGGISDSSIPWAPPTTIDPIVHWLTRLEVATPVENIVTPSPLGTTIATANVTKDRGRSLDEEVTVVPLMTLEEITLFPTLPSDSDDDVDQADPLTPALNDDKVWNGSSTTGIDEATLFPTLPLGVFDDAATSPATSESNDTASDGDVKLEPFPANETMMMSTEGDNVTELLQHATTEAMEDVDSAAITTISPNLIDDSANSSDDGNVTVTTDQLSNTTMDNSTVTSLDARIVGLPSKGEQDINETLPVEVRPPSNDTNTTITEINESSTTSSTPHENVTVSSNVTSTNETSSGIDDENMSSATDFNVTRSATTTSSSNDTSNVQPPSDWSVSDISNVTDGANVTTAAEEVTESSYTDWTTEDFTSWNDTSDVTEI